MIPGLEVVNNNMKDEILKEALEWYSKQSDKNSIFIEDFVDLLVNKTADILFEKVQEELKNEFNEGHLKHPFIISNDYYLYLKLKEIKYNILEKYKVKSSDLNNLSKKTEKINIKKQ